MTTNPNYNRTPDQSDFKRIIDEFASQPIRDFTMLVAVSGGPDSVYLLRAIHKWFSSVTGNGKLVVAHINHKLRKEESDKDAEFVQSLCQSLEIPCELESLIRSGTPASNRGQSLEANLRTERYDAFERMAAKHGARFVATGHTRDDQVETVLFRIMRGTGIDGLSGIPKARKINDSLTVIRPLLGFSKSRILRNLDEMGQDFREDKSNQGNQFTRNRIRHSILPLLRESLGNIIDDSIMALSNRAQTQTKLLARLAAPLEREHFTITPDCIRVNTIGLSNYDAELVTIAIREAWMRAGFQTNDMNSEKWRELRSLILSDASTPTNKKMFPGQVVVNRVANGIEIRRQT